MDPIKTNLLEDFYAGALTMGEGKSFTEKELTALVDDMSVSGHVARTLATLGTSMSELLAQSDQFESCGGGRWKIIVIESMRHIANAIADKKNQKGGKKNRGRGGPPRGRGGGVIRGGGSGRGGGAFRGNFHNRGGFYGRGNNFPRGHGAPRGGFSQPPGFHQQPNPAPHQQPNHAPPSNDFSNQRPLYRRQPSPPNHFQDYEPKPSYNGPSSSNQFSGDREYDRPQSPRHRYPSRSPSRRRSPSPDFYGGRGRRRSSSSPPRHSPPRQASLPGIRMDRWNEDRRDYVSNSRGRDGSPPRAAPGNFGRRSPSPPSMNHFRRRTPSPQQQFYGRRRSPSPRSNRRRTPTPPHNYRRQSPPPMANYRGRSPSPQQRTNQRGRTPPPMANQRRRTPSPQGPRYNQDPRFGPAPGSSGSSQTSVTNHRSANPFPPPPSNNQASGPIVNGPSQPFVSPPYHLVNPQYHQSTVPINSTINPQYPNQRPLMKKLPTMQNPENQPQHMANVPNFDFSARTTAHQPPSQYPTTQYPGAPGAQKPVPWDDSEKHSRKIYGAILDLMDLVGENFPVKIFQDYLTIKGLDISGVTIDEKTTHLVYLKHKYPQMFAKIEINTEKCYVRYVGSEEIEWWNSLLEEPVKEDIIKHIIGIREQKIQISELIRNAMRFGISAQQAKVLVTFVLFIHFGEGEYRYDDSDDTRDTILNVFRGWNRDSNANMYNLPMEPECAQYSELIECRICYFYCLEKFTVIAADDLPMFEVMDQELQSLRLDQFESPEGGWQVGHACLVPIPTETNGMKWARGNLRLPERGFWRIFLIDYGHMVCKQLSDMKLLPQKFMSVPACGIRCELSNLEYNLLDSLGQGWKQKLMNFPKNFMIQIQKSEKKELGYVSFTVKLQAPRGKTWVDINKYEFD